MELSGLWILLSHIQVIYPQGNIQKSVTGSFHFLGEADPVLVFFPGSFQKESNRLGLGGNGQIVP